MGSVDHMGRLDAEVAEKRLRGCNMATDVDSPRRLNAVAGCRIHWRELCPLGKLSREHYSWGVSWECWDAVSP